MMKFTDSVVNYVLFNEVNQPDDRTITDQDCLEYLTKCGITQYDVMSYREKLCAKREEVDKIKRRLIYQYIDTTNRQEMRLAYIGLSKFPALKCANMDYWPQDLSELKAYIESGPPENYLARMGYEWVVNGQDIPLREVDRDIHNTIMNLYQNLKNDINVVAQEIADRLQEDDICTNN